MSEPESSAVEPANGIDVGERPNDIPSTCMDNDVVLEAVRCATNLSCLDLPETMLFNALMDEVSSISVKTVGHIPRSVRPLLGHVLSTEFKHATFN